MPISAPKGDIMSPFFYYQIFINKRDMKRVIISEKQLESLVGALRKVNEEHKEGSYMAKQQLYVIATLAMAMWENMEDGEQLEDWMESKIAQCEQSIVSVVKTFMYDEFADENDMGGMGKLDFKDIVIGK